MIFVNHYCSIIPCFLSFFIITKKKDVFALFLVTIQTKMPERLPIYYFEILRKRPNEQKRVRLEQPSHVEN